MAEWRRIHTRFWRDPEVLDMTPEDKLFYLYVLSNPNTTAVGCYEMPTKLAAVELGYSLETVVHLIERFVGYGKIRYNEATREVLIVNWFKYNPASQSPKVRVLLSREAAGIKSPEFREAVLAAIGYSTDRVSVGDGYSIDTLSVELAYSIEAAQNVPRLEIEREGEGEKTTPLAGVPLASDPPATAMPPPKKPLATRPRKAETTYPREWYRQCETVYQEAKGITLVGDEFAPVQRELKSMFRSGNTPDGICAFMLALAASTVSWTEGWTIKTVRMKLPEFRAGKLNLNGTQHRMRAVPAPSNALRSGADYAALEEIMDRAPGDWT